jgi:hypothetical protein
MPQSTKREGFVLGPKGRLRSAAKQAMIGYTQMDLGIAKYHFKIGAGKESFDWILDSNNNCIKKPFRELKTNRFCNFLCKNS